MIERIKKRIFSDTDVNTGRQTELDLARMVIIFCLALIHCTIECSGDEALTNGIPYFFDTIIGGPFSAPMYMFVMGIGMVYTKNSNPEHHLKRGFQLLCAGYGLNICRFFIPYTLGYLITGEYGKYIEPLLYKMLGNDILIFAGLAMMLISLLVKLQISNIVMIIMGTVMSVIGTFFIGADAGNPLGNIFLGYLIGTEDAAGMVLSDFPILNWMIFPVCGYVFGKILKRVQDITLFYLSVSVPALLFAVVYFIYGLKYEIGMFGEGQNCYYHMIYADALASLALTVGMIGVYHFASKILPQKIIDISKNVSKNITAVYCIHWILISFLVNVLMYVARGTQELPASMVMLLGSAISIVSILIAHYYRKWKERSRQCEKIS